MLATLSTHLPAPVTGLTSITGDLSGKRLELLTETIQKLSRVAVLYDPGDPAKVAEFKETQAAAQGLGVQIQALEVRNSREFESAFKSATSWKGNALVVLQTVITQANHKQIVERATKNRLPAMFGESEYTEAGGSCPMDRAIPTCFGERPPSSTKS